MIYWCWSANSSGGKLTILTMRLAHHFAVWDFAFSISEPSRSRGHAADQIHQETLEKNHHHHHYYSLVIFYISYMDIVLCLCTLCDVRCWLRRPNQITIQKMLCPRFPLVIDDDDAHTNSFVIRSWFFNAIAEGRAAHKSKHTRAPLIVVLCVTRTLVERKREKQLDYYYHRLCFGDCCFSFHNRVQCVRHEYSQFIQSTFSPLHLKIYCNKRPIFLTPNGFFGIIL